MISQVNYFQAGHLGILEDICATLLVGHLRPLFCQAEPPSFLSCLTLNRSNSSQSSTQCLKWPVDSPRDQKSSQIHHIFDNLDMRYTSSSKIFHHPYSSTSSRRNPRFPHHLDSARPSVTVLGVRPLLSEYLGSRSSSQVRGLKMVI